MSYANIGEMYESSKDAEHQKRHKHKLLNMFAEQYLEKKGLVRDFFQYAEEEYSKLPKRPKQC